MQTEFGASVTPVDAAAADGVPFGQIDELEPQLTRHGYNGKSLAEQFNAQPLDDPRAGRGGLNRPVSNQTAADR